MIRVLIADDQPLMRTGFRMILDAEPDLEVVGEAADHSSVAGLRLSSAGVKVSILVCVPCGRHAFRRARMGTQGMRFARFQAG
jgi:DNA-binding NarL/FixJ family response regulator